MSATVFIVAGEESGDILGANLMRELRARLGDVRFLGVGGRRMSEAGISSLLPISEISLHGIGEVVLRIPRLLSRIAEISAAVVAADPDVLVLVDVPSFNLRVARRVRALNPKIPIVDYVSPTVWAYFAWRARRMAPHVDRLLALLPFEPAVHRQLGGPSTVYVGHPVIERLAELRPAAGERSPLGPRPVLLVLPGSRRSEIRRLMGVFGETVAEVVRRFGPVEVVLPAVPHLAAEIHARAAEWSAKPTIVEGEAAAHAAFRRGHAALAASGTVTLELALAEVPQVVAYKVDPAVSLMGLLLRSRAMVDSIVLPNLIAGRNAVPEFLNSQARPQRLADALLPLLSDTPERRDQLAAFADVERAMVLEGGTPSSCAADEVIAAMRRRPPTLAGPT